MANTLDVNKSMFTNYKALRSKLRSGGSWQGTATTAVDLGSGFSILTELDILF